MNEYWLISSVQQRASLRVQSSEQFSLCTFFSPIYTFSWRETQLFTGQVKVKVGKSTL